MAEGIQPLPDPTHVYNHDLVFVWDMINRFIEEDVYATSGSVSGMNDHDKRRVRAYIAAVNQKLDYIEAQPQLDLPKTYPRSFALEEAPVVKNIESEVMNQIARLWEALRTEIVHSSSARIASTADPHDMIRWRAILNKMTSFMDDYVDNIVPLDLPESTPREPVAGHGKSRPK